MNFRNPAEQVFLAGVKSVLPDQLIKAQVSIQGSTLLISSHAFPMDKFQRVIVIGAGKASALMAKEIESILGNRITGGYIVTKYGHACDLKYITVAEAGHPVPDNNGYLAARKIMGIVATAQETDLIICLISGGGSALLADFPEGVSLNDVIITNNLLIRSGADIKEINCVRKHLSLVKGGQLAKAVRRAFLVSLILSDVIGDPLDAIASGPTVPDSTTFGDAMDVLERYKLISQVPKPVLSYLKRGAEGFYPETPKPGDSLFEKAANIVIGSNKIALEAARQTARALGLNPIIVTSALQGNAMSAAEKIVNDAVEFQKDGTKAKPSCLLYGGETSLEVTGGGMGGRNQHLALNAALRLRGRPGITVLSAGTDGTDGPTNAAGAVVDSKTIELAFEAGVDVEKYLNNFDSFHFFEKVGGQIITGPTMTNVMDLIVVIIE